LQTAAFGRLPLAYKNAGTGKMLARRTRHRIQWVGLWVGNFRIATKRASPLPVADAESSVGRYFDASRSSRIDEDRGFSRRRSPDRVASQQNVAGVVDHDRKIEVARTVPFVFQDARICVSQSIPIQNHVVRG
jgi:hypothetical protein